MLSQKCLASNSQLNSIQVSLKDPKTADAKHYDAAKKQVEEQGGTIVNEYKLIKGFTYVFLLPLLLLFVR